VPGNAPGPAHIGAQRLGHGDPAIRLLVILDDGQQGASDREARAVQRVQQFRFAGIGVAPAGLEAARLEIPEITA